MEEITKLEVSNKCPFCDRVVLRVNGEIKCVFCNLQLSDDKSDSNILLAVEFPTARTISKL